eukprot:6260127-Pyramimonas_sp.AAC.1
MPTTPLAFRSRFDLSASSRLRTVALMTSPHANETVATACATRSMHCDAGHCMAPLSPRGLLICFGAQGRPGCVRRNFSTLVGFTLCECTARPSPQSRS